MSYRDGEDIDVIFLTESGTAASRKVSQLSLHKWFGRGSFCTDTSCFCKFRGISPPLSWSFMDFMAKSQRIWGLNWGFWFYMSVCSQRVHVGSVVLLWRRQVTGTKYYCQKGNRGADHFLCTYLIVNYTMVIIGWLSFVPIGGNSKAVFLSKQIICDNSGVGLFAVNI